MLNSNKIHGVCNAHRNLESITFTYNTHTYFLIHRDRIEDFIDENKALMRRMYGDFQMTTEYGPPLQNSNKRKREASNIEHPPGVPDILASLDDLPRPNVGTSSGESYFSKWRSTRQTIPKPTNNRNQGQNQGSARPNVGPNPSSEPSSGRYVCVIKTYEGLFTISPQYIIR